MLLVPFADANGLELQAHALAVVKSLEKRVKEVNLCLPLTDDSTSSPASMFPAANNPVTARLPRSVVRNQHFAVRRT